MPQDHEERGLEDDGMTGEEEFVAPETAASWALQNLEEGLRVPIEKVLEENRDRIRCYDDMVKVTEEYFQEGNLLGDVKTYWAWD